MVLLFDLDEAQQAQRVLDRAAARQAVDRALCHARDLGGKPGLGLLAEYRSQIAAVESQILADHVDGDGSTRRAERLLADGKTSKREQRKKANRAKAVGKNQDLAAKLASGAMSEEQVDVIADASGRTDGEAAFDTDLIDKVASVPPEQGKSIVDTYVADRATADGVQSEHDRQRALRRASKHHSKKSGRDVTSLEGDGVACKAMWDAILRRADLLYKRDGGRDLAIGEHRRTNDQRKFDAAYELICGVALHPNGATTDVPIDPAADGDSTGGGAKNSRRYTPQARPRIVIGLTVDKLLGLDPAAAATQHGLGPLADSVLASYAAHAEIFAALFDREGEPLWLGRLHRYATQTQLIALVLRDRHCVLCGADHTRCQAHHTMPWNAQAQGRTDLDQLVLLCASCHHQLHTEKRTIYQDLKRVWRTRPATPDELPPPRPGTDHNRPRRE